MFTEKTEFETLIGELKQYLKDNITKQVNKENRIEERDKLKKELLNLGMKEEDLTIEKLEELRIKLVHAQEQYEPYLQEMGI